MMPPNRGVGALPRGGVGTSQWPERTGRSERFGECLRQVQQTGGETALWAAVLPALPGPAIPDSKDESSRSAAQRPPRLSSDSAPTQPGSVSASQEEQTRSGDSRAEEVDRAAAVAASGGGLEASAEAKADVGAGAEPLPQAVHDRLLLAVRQAVRERREVVVLELEPPGGGVVEIRLDRAADRPALRLVCHGWNGYLPLARELPALQARLLQVGVVLQDISLLFERPAEPLPVRAERVEKPGARSRWAEEDEDGDGERDPKASRRRR
ncbi:MAG: hypothetical protein GYA21_02495 [Myxococcales bacterium]|nr:hypothetical protein [Myxococcales bacterium]